MTWLGPLHSHVSQIHPDSGSGQADCWQSSLARYLYEAGKVSLNRDPWDLINEISIASRGTPDSPGNADTDLQEASASLTHYGLPAGWTSSFQAALAAPWSIVLVNGIVLAPAQYPASFFGGANWPDHFILWLPQWGGAANWFNDPLAYTNGQQDCQYNLSSVAAAFGGAYLLPTTGRGETGPIQAQVLKKCGLKSQPNHTCQAIGQIPAGAQVAEIGAPVKTGAEPWQKVQVHGVGADKIGFVLASNLKAA